jgi:small subunit ribosomal protein S1
MESPVVTQNELPPEVKTKARFTGTVVKTSLAGALIDIGIGKPAVIHISQIVSPNQNEPIKRVEDVLHVGQNVDVWVRRAKPERIELTMIKPLDLEWREIKKDMIVKGTVVRLEKFGAFVDIGAERPALVHVSEMAHGFVRSPSDVVKEGDTIEAQVLEVDRRKKQIKLSMKALQPSPEVIMAEVNKPVETESQEKPRRRKTSRKTRSETPAETHHHEEKQPEAEPTVMELKLREAMARAKSRKAQTEARSKKAARPTLDEREEILARTLEHKVRTS